MIKANDSQGLLESGEFFHRLENVPDNLNIIVSPPRSNQHTLGPLANETEHQQRAHMPPTAKLLSKLVEIPHRENNSPLRSLLIMF